MFGDDSLSLSELADNLKDFLLANFTKLYYKVLNESMPEYLTPIYGIKDELPLIELAVSNIIQPGGKDTFNPKQNAVQFKSRTAKVRPVKADIEFKHSKIQSLYKSYLGQVKAGRIDPTTLPFEAEIMNRIAIAIKNDVRMRVLFKGVYSANGTAAADCVNGFLKIIADEVAGGGITSAKKTAGAALTSSNAYDQVNLIVDKVMADQDYSNIPMVMLIAPSRKRLYDLDFQGTLGATPYNTQFKNNMVLGTNIEFIEEPGMEGSDRIIVTPKENLLFIADDPSGMESLDVDYDKRTRSIAVMADFQMAPEFAIIEQVWVNDYNGIV